MTEDTKPQDTVTARVTWELESGDGFKLVALDPNDRAAFIASAVSEMSRKLGVPVSCINRVTSKMADDEMAQALDICRHLSETVKALKSAAPSGIDAPPMPPDSEQTPSGLVVPIGSLRK